MSIITTQTSTSQSELTALRAAIALRAPVPAGPVSILDRLAMRVGLALILWSRGHRIATGHAGRTVDFRVRDLRFARYVAQQRPFC